MCTQKKGENKMNREKIDFSGWKDLLFIVIVVGVLLWILAMLSAPTIELYKQSRLNKDMIIVQNLEYTDQDGNLVKILDVREIIQDQIGRSVKVITKDGFAVFNNTRDYKVTKEYFEKLEDGTLVQRDGLKE